MSIGGSVAAKGIDLYRIFLRPLRASGGATCRFTPSCSEYAAQAFQTWGFFRGAWLSVRRLARCHPWGGFGDDPVPERPHREEPDEHHQTLTAQPHQPHQPRSHHVRL